MAARGGLGVRVEGRSLFWGKRSIYEVVLSVSKGGAARKKGKGSCIFVLP